MSKRGRRGETVQTVPSHKHCPVCGRPIPLNRDFCSRICEEKWKERKKREKRWSLIWLIFAMASMAILFILVGIW